MTPVVKWNPRCIYLMKETKINQNLTILKGVDTWKNPLTVRPIVCLGPTVTSNLPPPTSRKEILCRMYTGMATTDCEPMWYDRSLEFPSGGINDSTRSDCRTTDNYVNENSV